MDEVLNDPRAVRIDIALCSVSMCGITLLQHALASPQNEDLHSMRDRVPISRHAALSDGWYRIPQTHALGAGRTIPTDSYALRGEDTDTKHLPLLAEHTIPTQQLGDEPPILVAMSPANEDVYNKAAQMVTAGKFAESVPLITDLIRLDGLKPEFFVLRSRAYIGANRPRVALADARKATSLAPKSADGYYQQAAAYVAMRQPQAALSCSDTARKLGGPRWYYSVTRSEIFEQLNQPKESLAAAEEAINLKPDESLCYFRKAVALIMLHRDQEALAMSNKAIGMAPHSYYFFKRAQAYLALKKYTEAIADFNEVQRLEVNPNAELYRLRGYAYTQLHDYTHASKDYERIPHQNLTLLEDRAKLHRRTHDTTSLLDDLNQILKLQPNNIDALHERPFVLFAAGAYQDCVNDCSKMIAASSDNSQWYYLRGYSYAKLKSYDSAASDLTKALQAAPKYRQALELRSKVYRKLGKESLAIKDEQMATELSIKQ